MPGRGLEPLRISPPDPKSGASANFATLANSVTSTTRNRPSRRREALHCVRGRKAKLESAICQGWALLSAKTSKSNHPSKRQCQPQTRERFWHNSPVYRHIVHIHASVVAEAILMHQELDAHGLPRIRRHVECLVGADRVVETLMDDS